MNLGQARRLKVGDEVTIRVTNEVVKIISLTPKRNIIMVGAMTRDGLKSLYNDEVIL